MLASLGPRGPLRDSGASDLGRAGSRAGDRVPSSSSMSSRSDRDSWLFISESVSASKAVPPPSRLLSEPLSEPSLALAESWLESESKPSLRSLSSPALGGWRRRRRQERRENFRLFLTSPAGGAAGGGSGPGASSFSKGSSVQRGQSGGASGQTGARKLEGAPPHLLPSHAHAPLLPQPPQADPAGRIPPQPAPVPSLWNAGTGFSASSSPACSRILTWLTRCEKRARVKAMAALYCLEPKARKARRQGPRAVRRRCHSLRPHLTCSPPFQGSNYFSKLLLRRKDFSGLCVIIPSSRMYQPTPCVPR